MRNLDETSVITVLTGQHRGVDQLFGELEKLDGSSSEEAERLARQAVIQLVQHSVAEEIAIYPSIRERLPDGDRIAHRQVAILEDAERTMKSLESLGPGDAEFWPTVHRLIDQARKHEHEEEFFVFPQMLREYSDDELREMSRTVLQLKQVAPTRPHPGSPAEGGALAAVAPGAGMVDRLRDAITGRGR